MVSEKSGHVHMRHHCLICGRMVVGRWMCRECGVSEAKRLGLELLGEEER